MTGHTRWMICLGSTLLATAAVAGTVPPGLTRLAEIPASEDVRQVDLGSDGQAVLIRELTDPRGPGGRQVYAGDIRVLGEGDQINLRLIDNSMVMIEITGINLAIRGGDVTTLGVTVREIGQMETQERFIQIADSAIGAGMATDVGILLVGGGDQVLKLLDENDAQGVLIGRTDNATDLTVIRATDGMVVSVSGALNGLQPGDPVIATRGPELNYFLSDALVIARGPSEPEAGYTVHSPALLPEVDSTTTVIPSFHYNINLNSGVANLVSVRETGRNDTTLYNNFSLMGGPVQVQPTAVSFLNDFVFIGGNWYASLSEDRGDLVAYQDFVQFSGPQDLSEPSGLGPPKGDVDDDADVDLDDARAFFIIFKGLTAQSDPNWQPINADMDDDGDIDFVDRELFQHVYTEALPSTKGLNSLDPDFRNPALGFVDFSQGDPVPGFPGYGTFTNYALRGDGQQLVFLQRAVGPGGLADQITLLRHFTINGGYRTVLNSTQDLGDGPIAQFGLLDLSEISETGGVALHARLADGREVIYRVDLGEALESVFSDGFE